MEKHGFVGIVEAWASVLAYNLFGEGRLVRYDLEYAGRNPVTVQVVAIQIRLVRDGH